MSKLFQIREEDLAELEHTLPSILDAMYPMFSKDNGENNRLRTQWRRVREIVANVRWNYGPPTEVEVIDAQET